MDVQQSRVMVMEQKRKRLMFEIPGEAVPKARPRVVTVRGKNMTFTPDKTKSFENLVKLMYVNQCKDQKLDGPISATIHIFRSIPKSTSKKNRACWLMGRFPVTTKGDCDNYAKAVLDSLNGIAYNDDAQVAELYVTKEYSDKPRTMVILREIENIGIENLEGW